MVFLAVKTYMNNLAQIGIPLTYSVSYFNSILDIPYKCGPAEGNSVSGHDITTGHIPSDPNHQ